MADRIDTLAGCFAIGEPVAHRIFLTLVHTRSDGDAFFPEIPPVFVEIGRERAEDAYPIEYLIYERK